MNNMNKVSIILYTVIQSDSLARVFKGDSANKSCHAEFRGFRRSRRDSLRHVKKFLIIDRIDMAVILTNSWRSAD